VAAAALVVGAPAPAAAAAPVTAAAAGPAATATAAGAGSVHADQWMRALRQPTTTDEACLTHALHRIISAMALAGT
jgi:hypothetical protein